MSGAFSLICARCRTSGKARPSDGWNACVPVPGDVAARDDLGSHVELGARLGKGRGRKAAFARDHSEEGGEGPAHVFPRF